MGLRIINGTSGLAALRALQSADRSSATAIERLATGKRVNRAGDDPSAFGAINTFRTRIAGMGQALENIESGKNMIATADSGLKEVNDLLISIRGSVVAALSTGGSSPEQIASEQASVNSALEAIDRIAQSTTFGSRRLLDGSSGIIATKSASILDLDIKRANIQPGFTNQTFQVRLVTAPTRASLDTNRNQAQNVASGGNVTVRITGMRGSETFEVASGLTTSAFAQMVNAVAQDTGVAMYFSAGGDLNYRTLDYGNDAFITVERLGGTGTLNVLQTTLNRGVDGVATIDGEFAVYQNGTYSVDKNNMNVSLFISRAAAAGTSHTFTVRVGQGIGLNVGDDATTRSNLNLGIRGVNSGVLGSLYESQLLTNAVNNNTNLTLTYGGRLASLRSGGLNDLDSNPSNALGIIDRALSQVGELRNYLGNVNAQFMQSSQNVMEENILNLQEAASSLENADFAQEAARLASAQVQFQASVAMLAAANLQPQTVLTLLT